ncbi:MAG TPA: VanZ family protein [Candidatus Binataceae bacterium]|nr:VanZ family protein [Candidatus Binataceae bacterium]
MTTSTLKPPLGGNPAASSGLTAWAPPILWIGLMFVLSTSLFSAANTVRVIEPILRWIAPAASAATIAMLHGFIRKTAHFVNYGILFWLLIRGPMAGRPYAALGLCVLQALLDEGHQVFVPGRTASIYDVALDSSGALFSRFLNAAIAEPL